jgi:hypothetical protein
VKPRDQIGLLLARGAVALVLIIAIGAFGRAFYLAVALGEDHPISDAATQLLTALGSALVGGAVGYIGGTNMMKEPENDEDFE